MWCIGRITAEYRERMYGLLGSTLDRMMRRNRWCASMRKASSCSGRPVRRSPGSRASASMRITEYRRAGTRNLFVAVEPKGKRRCVEVTARRTKVDFVAFIKNLLETV